MILSASTIRILLCFCVPEKYVTDHLNFLDSFVLICIFSCTIMLGLVVLGLFSCAKMDCCAILSYFQPNLPTYT